MAIIEAVAVPAQARKSRAGCARLRHREQIAAGASSGLQAFRRAAAAAGRKPLASSGGNDESDAIDNAITRQEADMNANQTATRLQSLLAAALMTLVTLGAIDHLAATEHSGLLAERAQATERA
jgi:hypothetical protein